MGTNATRIRRPDWRSRDGSINLWHGDNRDVLPGWNRCISILTDPPYGIEYDSAKSKQRDKTVGRPIAGDDVLVDVSMFDSFADALVWCVPTHTITPLRVGAWYGWDKVTQNNLKVRIAEVEWAWHRSGTKSRLFRHLWSGAYRASESKSKRRHPNQKPIALWRWCLRHMSDVVAVGDPYFGSGSSAAACMDAGVRYYGCELDDVYFNEAVAFLEKRQVRPGFRL